MKLLPSKALCNVYYWLCKAFNFINIISIFTITISISSLIESDYLI